MQGGSESTGLVTFALPIWRGVNKHVNKFLNCVDHVIKALFRIIVLVCIRVTNRLFFSFF